MQQENGDTQPLQGEFSQSEIDVYNSEGYNIYYYPNYPKFYHNDGFIKGKDIDTFEWVFVDMDLKDGVYTSKEEFVSRLTQESLMPTKIVDSGGGIHAYWRITDLDSTSFLTLNRRLARLFNTDLAVGKIKQLMRVPNTVNTKNRNEPKLCQTWHDSEILYTCEDLDKMLPKLSAEDDEYCKRHYDQTYNTNTSRLEIDESLPPKFGELLDKNLEVKEIWLGNTNDRSKSDFRLGHLMLASGFTKAEALSVLVNSGKALGRSLGHRISYAENIIDKIWTFEEVKGALPLSSTVREILERSGEGLKGTRMACWTYLDNTVHGFRLGQVVGLVAGSGVGKTAVALNMFMGFVEKNPDLEHFFIPLEQPANEIADRWKTLCGTNIHLHEKVHVISNYDEKGGFRHLSLEDLQNYIVKFQEDTGKKVGCVVLDHIGVLRSVNKNGENEGLMGICKTMKSFAQKTDTLLVMQSQAPREKAGIGDLELNKDAAYGTVYFESYCDYLITMWQPLKRCYSQGAPTVTAFKFCKIRHKKQGYDTIKEDVPYKLMFDPSTECLRVLSSDEEKSFSFFLTQATNKRKEDKKTELVQYESVVWIDKK
jgi:KaiC/GvpD/RAD55 family RecA-like ATPase